MTTVALDLVDVTGQSLTAVPLNVIHGFAWVLSRTDKDAKTGTTTSEYIDDASFKPYQRTLVVKHTDAGNGILRNSATLSTWAFVLDADSNVVDAKPATFTVAFNIPALALDVDDLGNTLMIAVSSFWGAYDAATDTVDFATLRKVMSGLTGSLS